MKQSWSVWTRVSKLGEPPTVDRAQKSSWVKSLCYIVADVLVGALFGIVMLSRVLLV